MLEWLQCIIPARFEGMASHDTNISHVTLKIIMFWPTSPSPFLSNTDFFSISGFTWDTVYSYLLFRWQRICDPIFPVSVHSSSKGEVRWWIVKLTMLGLIQDEKTNDSPFWLVSTRTSQSMFYWLCFLIDLTRQKIEWLPCSCNNRSFINISSVSLPKW